MRVGKNETGFSMVELVLVTSIVGLMASMSVAILPIVDSMRFKNETSKLREALVTARNWAVTHGKCVKVDVDPANRKLNISAFPLPANLNCSSLVGVAESVGSVAFDAFIELSDLGGGAPLIFGHRGATTRGDVARIAITNLASKAHAVFSVIPGTGKVSGK